MELRPLGRTGLKVSPIGFGAFKIGRNAKVKYPSAYDLPDETTAGHLLNAILDLGICYIDTAPAYGFSEERIGRAVAHRRQEFVLSTKVGEQFESGESTYDFSAAAVKDSIHRSLQRLRTECLDVVFIHAPANDQEVLRSTDAVETLQALQSEGAIRFIGLSAKTIAAAQLAMEWADALMIEYHVSDDSFSGVIEEAGRHGIGVVIKKALASGHLPAVRAIPFALSPPAVSSVVVGSLSIRHLRENLDHARATDSAPD